MMTLTRAVRLAGVALAVAALPAAASATGAPPSGGERLYQQHCAPCHGPKGRGDGPDAPLFTTPPANLHGGAIRSASPNNAVKIVLDGRHEGILIDEKAMRARSRDVESVVAYLQRLPEIDWRKADEGAVIYTARCAPCHGPYGRPSAAPPAGVRAPRDFTTPEFQRSVTDAELMSAVRHGRAGMPALTPRLSEAEAQDVAAFVRLLSPGFTTYSQYCANCHGDHGIGGGSFAESTMQPTAVFDRAYFARHDREALRSQVWHMLEERQPRMPHFRGQLSDAEVRAIVEYLRSH